MLKQLAVGGGISLLNIAIHAMFMVMVVAGVRSRLAILSRRHPVARLLAVMISTITVLMVAHTIEVGVWAISYRLFEVAPESASAFYFAFVNYATLGYGDVLPAEGWRLIGPITAMNGMLLFGLSTAVIFEALRVTAIRLHLHMDPD
jgi:hypothetical protein